MRVLVVLNDPPYGTERSYKGLRLTNALAKREQTEVRVFLLGTPSPAPSAANRRSRFEFAAATAPTPRVSAGS